MLFVRKRNGSHNLDEAVDLPNFVVAVDIVYAFLIEGEGIS